ncbi:MAG: SDR family NAD(P)-dependent oxidoreductase [bacterium]
MRFLEKVVIVTGAARGIGRAIAEGFLAEGAKVALADLDRAFLEKTVEQLGGGPRLIAVPCDVGRCVDVEDMVARVLEIWGRLDVLVNNAGIIRRGNIETVTEDDWEKVLEVNLKGAFLCSKAVVGIMKAQSRGVIINVSSIAGKMGDITSAPGYASSKAGMDALTKTLARHLAPYGVRANGVSPHAIETEMSAQWTPERRKEIIASIPLGRLGKPEDVARAVLFLASDEASFITGEILDVNGGALMD